MPQDNSENSRSNKDEVPAYFDVSFFRAALECGLRAGAIAVHDLQLKNSTVGGENYCSNIYQARVRYSNDQAADAVETDVALVVKSMPHQKQGPLSRLQIYAKETHFYMELKPQMEALMWHAEQAWHLGARHYYSTNQPEQTIVFGDLCVEGFRLQSRQLGLDLPHARLVIQKLAQYHALSMLFVERQPDEVRERYPYGLLNAESIRAPPFKALFGAQLLKLIALLAGSEDSDGAELTEISKKLMRYYEQFVERVLQCVYPLEGKWNVLNHGDLWVNNILFRYGSEGQPQEARFIDFQLCFYGSPGCDINYFLNTSVQLAVLQQQRCTLVGVYHETLVRTLRRLPYGGAVPSYEDVLRELRQREAYGLFVAFAFFPLMSMVNAHSQDNSLENFQDESFAKKKIELMFESNPRTLQTLKYALKRWHDLGVLD